MAPLDLLLLTVVRALSFALLLFFIPRKVLPLSVRAACAMTLTVFAFSGSHVESSLPAALGGASESLARLTWEALFYEVGMGLFLAVIIGAPALVVLCLGAWANSVILPQTDSVLRHAPEERILFFTFILWFFVAVLDLPGWREVFLLFGSSISMHSSGAPFAADGLFAALAYSGRTALSVSLLLVAPLVFAALALDLVVLLAGRYFRELSTRTSVCAVKIPLLALLLMLSLYPLSRELRADSAKLRSYAAQALHEQTGR